MRKQEDARIKDLMKEQRELLKKETNLKLQSERKKFEDKLSLKERQLLKRKVQL